MQIKILLWFLMCSFFQRSVSVISMLIIAFVALVIVSVVNVLWAQRGRQGTRVAAGTNVVGAYRQFLSKVWTNNVRGVAILMIILAHIVTENTTAAIFRGGITRRIVSGFGGFGVGVFFFLSGYGNYLSVSESKRLKWLLRRFGKLLLGFVICFSLVTAVQFVLGQGSWQEIGLNFITLKMPNTYVVSEDAAAVISVHSARIVYPGEI